MTNEQDTIAAQRRLAEFLEECGAGTACDQARKDYIQVVGVFERRAGDQEGPSDSALWKFVNSPPPSAQSTATIRRPDGTIITCPVDQIGEVLEQIRRSTPSVLQHRCDALETAVRAGLVEAQTTVNRW